MDESPTNLENILEQAPKWTFAGDFTLLEWMKQISKDLESRAAKTTNALSSLNNNIKSTNIALDNVANCLTTLQFGNQFVECRVQDDDENLINSRERITIKKENQPEVTVTSEELLNTFLDNNLKVLRNCHERYSIDLDDSDDEEITKEKTCIYQPINPYNEKPLPYIFGSKDWHSKWHVGLYENEQDNSYSGDEMSEVFSEASSTSHWDDNESFESNTECASSYSIDNDNFNANIEIKNASSLRGLQALHPGTPVPATAVKSKSAAISESSSVSTTPSSLAAKNSMLSKQQQANLTKRSESMSSVTSRTSSKQKDNNKEKSQQYKPSKQKVVDLFAEPAGVSENVVASSVSSGQNVKGLIFDNQAAGKAESPALRSQPAAFVDLFAEPPEDFTSSTTSSLSSSHHTKRKIVNLFDDNDDSLTFTYAEKSIKSVDLENEVLPAVATSKSFSVTKTSKWLFDDSDDDDDDFLKTFVNKSLSKEAVKSSISKTILFDNETNDPKINSLPQTNDNKNKSSEEQSGDKVRIPIGKAKTKEFDLFSNKLTSSESQMPVQNPRAVDAIKSSIEPHLNTPPKAENLVKSENPITDFVADTKTRKKINLFDDLENRDDLFSTKYKNNEETSSLTVVRKIVELPKENIFEDKIATKATPDLEKFNKTELAKTDSILDHNSVPHKTEIMEKEETVIKNIVPETNDASNDIKSLQVDGENFVKPTLQDAITATPQPTQNIVASTPVNNDQEIKSSHKYEFSSILFSDEPPEDDDEFFETLAKTSSNSNSNYNAIDLENDIFEPDLPKVPVANTSSNQADVSDNFYTGLQLFSDIPPDDDDDNDAAMDGSVLNPASDSNEIKRLHSVFYDDFNETLMALNQNQIDKEIAQNSTFNDEPPAVNDSISSSSKDLTDHQVPDKEPETIAADYKNKIQESSSNSEEVLQQLINRNACEAPSKRPVSKLQMPHININVQALLPGASTALRKSKEDDNQSGVIPAPKGDATQATYPAKASSNDDLLRSAKNHLAETSRTFETEHILPNMTRNRVKAPATRRPSTRKARQENYRKSLIEQQDTLASDDEALPEKNKAIRTATKDIISQALQQQKNSNNYLSHLPKIPATSICDENKNQTVSHSSQHTKSARNEAVKSAIEIPTESALSRSEIAEVSTNDAKAPETLSKTLKNVSLTLKSKQLNNSLFFDADEEDDDDDFFKHIKTSNIKAKDNDQNLLTKSSLAARNSSHLENNTSMAIAQEPQPPAFLNKVVASNDGQSETTTGAEIKKSNQYTSKNLKPFNSVDDEDDEDLFRATATTSKSSMSSKDLNSKAKSQFRSFLDSETDEEPKIAGQRTTMPPTLSTASSSTNSKNKTTKDDKVKLFSDSETDSDDLFGKSASTKVSTIKKASTEVTTKSQTKPEPKSSTLFEDDSDSDDFLSSKNSLNKNVPKIATQTNASLFSDLDSDEDDLFGSGAAKGICASATNTKNPKSTATSAISAPAAADSSKSQSVGDNPLADLL